MATSLSTILSPTLTRPVASLPLYVPPAGSNAIWPPTTVSTDCGAITATVWKEIVNITAPGILRHACVQVGTTTSKRVGMRITIDGISIGELIMTSNSTTAAHGVTTDINAAGNYAQFPYLIGAPFQSLKVEAYSSVTLSAAASCRYFVDYILVR